MSKQVDLKNVPRFKIGLCWEPNDQIGAYDTEPKPHDLDLSCALLNAGGQVIELISPPYPKRDLYGFSIYHGGDHQSGGSDFEDEYVRVNLEKVAPEIASLVFIVSTKNKLKLAEVEDPVCEFRNELTDEMFFDVKLSAISPLSQMGAEDVVLVGMLSRNGPEGSWLLRGLQNMIPALDRSQIELAVQGLA